uniref:Cytochrome P450 n=1 Tax=Graphocephala atropunctata TaxID=36148 RepID=A0A1B6KYC2_9HEMI
MKMLPLSLTGVWLGDVIVLIALLIYIIYKYLTNTSDYFKVRGIPYLKPAFIVGYRGLLTKSSMDLSQSLYDSFAGDRFFGYFQARVPILLVKDPELQQLIRVKDFVHFQDQGFHVTGGNLLSTNLFNLRGHTWQSLRNKLNPTFTSGRLKLMFHQLVESGDHLLVNIERSYSGEPILAKNLTLDFVIEVIASCAFGMDFSKETPQTAEFISRSHSVQVSGYRKVFIDLMSLFAPKVLSLLGVRIHHPVTIEYFLNLVKTIKEYRKKNGVKRNDYFQQLLTLQEAEETGGGKIKFTVTDKDEKDNIVNQMQHFPRSPYTKETKRLTDECITSQAFGFLWSGSETVSETLSYALYHLGKDLMVQGRARKEVEDSLTRHGEWTYQAVQEMVYLDQVLQETLRLYPVMPLGFRECTMAYRIPLSDRVVEKGMIVAIPVRGLHMDPKFYPDPKRFDPDRFKGNNYKPSHIYMPFGDGPRICVAMRFAILEMKVCLAKILSRFDLQVDSKTQEPFRFDHSSFSPKPLGGVWLKLEKRRS